MKFSKGSRMYFRDGRPAYEKLDDEDCGWWVSLFSTYVVEKKNPERDELKYEARPESEKPLYNTDGKLNRFGFKWPDQQVYEYYSTFMKFEN